MRLLFMPDYFADPLWDVDSEGMVDLDQLPIDVALRARARSWAVEYTERGQTSGWADPFAGAEGAALQAAGHALWLELRTVLAPAHEVGYVSFPGDTRHVQWHPDGPLEPCPRGPRSLEPDGASHVVSTAGRRASSRVRATAARTT